MAQRQAAGHRPVEKGSGTSVQQRIAQLATLKEEQ
jgi:hypothetical protein